MKSIDLLFEETGMTINHLADRSGLPLDRVEAIVVGRWTPSPQERSRISEVFDTPVDQISWGHTMDPRNIRYRRFGMKENF